MSTLLCLKFATLQKVLSVMDLIWLYKQKTMVLMHCFENYYISRTNLNIFNLVGHYSSIIVFYIKIKKIYFMPYLILNNSIWIKLELNSNLLIYRVGLRYYKWNDFLSLKNKQLMQSISIMTTVHFMTVP